MTVMRISLEGWVYQPDSVDTTVSSAITPPDELAKGSAMPCQLNHDRPAMPAPDLDGAVACFCPSWSRIYVGFPSVASRGPVREGLKGST